MTPPHEEPIPSPCYGVCTLDANYVCIGCKRSQEEIKEWREADNPRRHQILENCKSRTPIKASLRRKRS